MTVGEFLTITDEDEIFKIKAIKQALEGRNHIGDYKSKPLMRMSFKKVQQVRHYYSEGNIVYLCSVTCNIGHKVLLSMDYKDLLYYLKWIDDELGNIGMLEERLNQSDPDEDKFNAIMQDAGVADMNIFEEINIIDSLADGDILKWEKIERLPYQNVYTKLLRNKIQAQIKRKADILSKPNT